MSEDPETYEDRGVNPAIAMIVGTNIAMIVEPEIAILEGPNIL